MLQVTLAYESIVLYVCEGKVLMDNNNNNLRFNLIKMEHLFFHKRNSQVPLLNKEITHTLTHKSTHYNTKQPNLTMENLDSNVSKFCCFKIIHILL